MDTSRIASFVATAEAGSLSRGAQRLDQQLSTVSRHVADLELELGAKLFERTGRGVKLTPAGAQFLERGRSILREVELARAEAKGVKAKEPSSLRFSAPPDLALAVLPPVLLALGERHPELVIHARSEVRRVSVVEEAYDAVVRLGALTPSDLIPTRLGALSLAVYASPGHELAKLSELSQRQVALVEGVPREVPAVVRGRKVKVSFNGRMHVGSMIEAGELAARSDQLVVLPSMVARAFVASGRLVPAAPWLGLPTVQVHLLRTPQHRGSKVMDDLAELLIGALSESETALSERRRGHGIP